MSTVMGTKLKGASQGSRGIPYHSHLMFLQREDHITGLVRLLSVALRALTVTEFVVRDAL
jgi:hypothetical protein